MLEKRLKKFSKKRSWLYSLLIYFSYSMYFSVTQGCGVRMERDDFCWDRVLLGRPTCLRLVILLPPPLECYNYRCALVCWLERGFWGEHPSLYLLHCVCVCVCSIWGGSLLTSSSLKNSCLSSLKPSFLDHRDKRETLLRYTRGTPQHPFLWITLSSGCGESVSASVLKDDQVFPVLVENSLAITWAHSDSITHSMGQTMGKHPEIPEVMWNLLLPLPLWNSPKNSVGY
jgi:hypothetical protein